MRGCPIQQLPRKDVIFCRAPCFLFRAILPLAAQAGEPVVNTSIFHGSKKKRKKKSRCVTCTWCTAFQRRLSNFRL